VQTFSKTGMVRNPLWPAAGKMPLQEKNFAPRVGLGYALGDDRPLMVRAGFGIFYLRIPQTCESAVMNNNGLTNNFLSLDSTNFYSSRYCPPIRMRPFTVRGARSRARCLMPRSSMRPARLRRFHRPLKRRGCSREV
jgi:hypothetical protein